MPRFHGLLASLVLALLAAPLAADGPRWVPLGPGGGLVRSLAVHPTSPNVAYAATGAGLYKTLNTGFSWVEVQGLHEVVQVAFAGPTTVYALTPSQIFKSVNGGATWAATASAGLPPFNRRIALAVDPTNPSRLYLIAPPGSVWRSGDGGETWRLASRGLGTDSSNVVRALATSHPSGTAFAATFSGLYKTTNAGASWMRLGHGLPAGDILAVAVSPSHSSFVYASLESGLYRSRDGGASWTRAKAPGSQPVYFLAAHPRFPRTVFAAADSFVFRSRDFGRTWTPLPPRTGALALAVHSGPTADVLYLGATLNTGGVLVSTDSGARWTVRNRGIHELPTTAVATDAGGALLAGTKGQGLFRVVNRNGPLWARTGMPAGIATGEIVNAAPGLFFASNNEALWRTTNAGVSWTIAPGLGPSEVAADSEAEGTAYALSFQRFARTTDAGATWTDLTPPPLDCFVRDLAMAPSSPPTARVLYAAGAGPAGPATAPCGDFSGIQVSPKVYRSSDGGASWVDASAGLGGQFAGPLAVDPLDANTVYAGGGGFNAPGPFGIWKSLDGGATWTQIHTPSYRVSDLVASSIPGRVYAALSLGGEILRSDDGGATWRRWNEGIIAIEVLDLAIDPVDPTRVYAATDRGVWVLEEED
ncbi:MAG TPA: hypothetical protein VG477_13250 [Thermoanaerobaculia bacterium]|nr:hypothetical protein [Thermoanaerobaculia bacterium]